MSIYDFQGMDPGMINMGYEEQRTGMIDTLEGVTAATTAAGGLGALWYGIGKAELLQRPLSRMLAAPFGAKGAWNLFRTGGSLARLGMLGRGAGMIGGLGVGIASMLPMLPLWEATTGFAEGMLDQRRSVNTASMIGTNIGKGVSTAISGVGFNYEERKDIGRVIYDVAEDLDEDVSDINNLLRNIKPSGFFDTVRNAEQAQEKIVELSKSVKKVSEIMKNTLDQASGFMAEAKMMGYESPADIETLARNVTSIAPALGLNSQQFAAESAYFVEPFAMRGRRGALGSEIFQYQTMIGYGAMNDPQLSDRTRRMYGNDPSKAAMLSTQVQQRFIESGYAHWAAAYAYQHGGLTRENLMATMGMSPRDIRSGVVNMSTVDRVKFLNDYNNLLSNDLKAGDINAMQLRAFKQILKTEDPSGQLIQNRDLLTRYLMSRDTALGMGLSASQAEMLATQLQSTPEDAMNAIAVESSMQAIEQSAERHDFFSAVVKPAWDESFGALFGAIRKPFRDMGAVISETISDVFQDYKKFTSPYNITRGRIGASSEEDVRDWILRGGTESTAGLRSFELPSYTFRKNIADLPWWAGPIGVMHGMEKSASEALQEYTRRGLIGGGLTRGGQRVYYTEAGGNKAAVMNDQLTRVNRMLANSQRFEMSDTMDVQSRTVIRDSEIQHANQLIRNRKQLDISWTLTGKKIRGGEFISSLETLTGSPIEEMTAEDLSLAKRALLVAGATDEQMRDIENSLSTFFGEAPMALSDQMIAAEGTKNAMSMINQAYRESYYYKGLKGGPLKNMLDLITTDKGDLDIAKIGMYGEDVKKMYNYMWRYIGTSDEGKRKDIRTNMQALISSIEKDPGSVWKKGGREAQMLFSNFREFAEGTLSMSAINEFGQYARYSGVFEDILTDLLPAGVTYGNVLKNLTGGERKAGIALTNAILMEDYGSASLKASVKRLGGLNIHDMKDLSKKEQMEKLGMDVETFNKFASLEGLKGSQSRIDTMQEYAKALLFSKAGTSKDVEAGGVVANRAVDVEAINDLSRSIDGLAVNVDKLSDKLGVKVDEEDTSLEKLPIG